jgi:hypothetical protein
VNLRCKTVIEIVAGQQCRGDEQRLLVIEELACVFPVSST